MGQKPSRGNRVDRESLKPGDHIFAWRTAALSVYAHHGIYVGGGEVIHLTSIQEGSGSGSGMVLKISSVSSLPAQSGTVCPNCSPLKNRHGVISSCLTCFLSGDLLYRFEYSVSVARYDAHYPGTCTTADSDPDDVVVYRAKYLLHRGFGCYKVNTNNCEHFAIYCKTGLVVVEEKFGPIGQAVHLLDDGFLRYFKPGCTDIGRREDAVKMSLDDLY